MRRFITVAGAVLLFATLASANDLKTYKATYEKEMDTIILSNGMSMTELGEHYTKSLDSLLAVAKRAGDLDKTTAVIDEIARFGKEKAMSATPSKALDIRNLQSRFVKQATLHDLDNARALIILTSRYDSALERLQKSLVSSSKLDDAKLVQTERKQVAEAEPLKAAKGLLTEYSKKPEGETARDKAAIRSAFSRPNSYICEIEGSAGLSPKNNTYTFNVERQGLRATLRYWATGAIYKQSYGNVVLRTPEGREEILHKWTPKDFKITAREADTYKSLKEKRIDVSKHVRRPGEYAIRFDWKSGGSGLTIMRVEVEMK
jgi:hypothetical protein